MHVEVPRRPLLHILEALVHPFGRRLGTGMNTDGEVESLRHSPEAIVVRMGVRFVGNGIGGDKRASGAVLRGSFQLPGGFRWVAKRDMGDRNQPPLGVPAEITDPPVVGAGVGGSEVYV